MVEQPLIPLDLRVPLPCEGHESRKLSPSLSSSAGTVEKIAKRWIWQTTFSSIRMCRY